MHSQSKQNQNQSSLGNQSDIEKEDQIKVIFYSNIDFNSFNRLKIFYLKFDFICQKNDQNETTNQAEKSSSSNVNTNSNEKQLKNESEPSTSIETPRFYSLRQNTKQQPIKKEPELIELTDSEDEEDKLSSKITKNHLNRSENENEIHAKSNDLNKSNTNLKDVMSALYSEWNLTSSDFEVMHQDILKQSQDLKSVESLKFDIDYIRMGGFTNYSKSDIQFDKDGLRINTTSTKMLFFNIIVFCFDCNAKFLNSSLTK